MSMAGSGSPSGAGAGSGSCPWWGPVRHPGRGPVHVHGEVQFTVWDWVQFMSMAGSGSPSGAGSGSCPQWGPVRCLGRGQVRVCGRVQFAVWGGVRFAVQAGVRFVSAVGSGSPSRPGSGSQPWLSDCVPEGGVWSESSGPGLDVRGHEKGQVWNEFGRKDRKALQVGRNGKAPCSFSLSCAAVTWSWHRPPLREGEPSAPKRKSPSRFSSCSWAKTRGSEGAAGSSVPA